jgi:hypothetical protein
MLGTEAPPSIVASRAGALGTAVVLAVFLGIAVSVDFPRISLGFKGDEATYYSLTHSIARDGDFTFQRRDLARVWEEYPGPEGIFLKRGSRVELQWTSSFPFVHLARTPDPSQVRLYYAKSYIYPLFAAPFVRVFGTTGFLVFHALLLAVNFAMAYAFLAARGTRAWIAAAFAAVFLFASIVPVYFVWLTPELFNVTLVFGAFFLWSYKLAVLPDHAPRAGRWHRFLLGPSSDYAAAVLLGIATFSKPTHILLVLPILAYTLWRRQLVRTMVTGACFAAVVAGLFLINLATTGEFNYQGGDRASFYGQTGFPFANTWETFDNIGHRTATDAVPTDIIFHGDTASVLGWNLLYFTSGRHSGLIPYFFPALVVLGLFLGVPAHRELWQWLVAATLAVSALALLSYMPYTYSGGGGPVGNRYFLSFYPLFLFLAPPIRSAMPAILALGIGMLFVGKILLNPFYSSFHPGEHAKAGPLRLLPIERTLLNDLPVSAHADRSRRALGGDPPISAYFPDDNAYTPEGGAFWTRGGRRADLLLRAATWQAPDGRVVPLRVRQLNVEITNGAVANRVTVSSGFSRSTVDLAPGEERVIELTPGAGVPYKPTRYPTNYIYTLSVSTTAGFAPFLEAPGESTDSRYLGVQVRVAPVYYNP